MQEEVKAFVAVLGIGIPSTAIRYPAELFQYPATVIG
jgi:hypothetical protein